MQSQEFIIFLIFAHIILLSKPVYMDQKLKNNILILKHETSVKENFKQLNMI